MPQPEPPDPFAEPLFMWAIAAVAVGFVGLLIVILNA